MIGTAESVEDYLTSYEITFFNASGAKRVRSVNVPLAAIVALPVILVVIAISLTVSLVSLSNLVAEHDETQQMLIKSADEITLKTSDEILQNVLSVLKNDDAFIGEIFASPIINGKYRFENVTNKFNAHTTFITLISQNKKNNFSDTESMEELVDVMNKEVDIRLAKYNEIEEYLLEKYFIYRHTPSYWPSPAKKATSSFGYRRSPFTGIPSYHEGTDCIARLGTPIFSAADGVVVFTGVRTGYGFLVTVDHGFGYITRYAHNSKLLVREGDVVKKGDLLSLSGSTGRSAGPHLHYEVLYNGVPVNSIKFLPGYQ